MAKKQSRRSISVNRSLFEQCKGVAETRGVPLAQLTEAALRRELTSSAEVPPTMFTGQEAEMILRGLAALDQIGRVHPNDKQRFDTLKARVLKISTALAPEGSAVENEPQNDEQAPDDSHADVEAAPELAEKVSIDETADEDTRVEYDEDAA